MRILQIIQRPQLRGAEIFACQLTSKLIALGHHVDVVHLFDQENKLSHFNLNFISLQANEKRRFMDFRAYKRLAKIIKEGKYDIVQANAGDTLKYASISRIIHKWHASLIYRNANKMSDFIKNRAVFLLNKILLRQVDSVISVSTRCERDFANTFHWPKEKIDTGTIGVELIQVGKVPIDLKELVTKGPILANIGSLVPEKNHARLLYMFKESLVKYPQAKLLIVGSGREESNLKYLANKLAIQSSVFFLGYRSDVLEIVKAADVFVLPSLIEGLPGVLLEAMYCKTPVVAYDVGGVGEVVKHKKTGWLIDKGDEPAFINAVIEVLEGNSVKQMVDHAFKEVVTNFDNEVVAKRFVNFYNKLLMK